MNILIVDDQSSTHKFLDHMIDWQSFGINQVFHAFNGEEAIEKVNEKRPEIMLLDIKMPLLDGIEVLKLIDDAKKPKTIILSAYNEFEYAREALRFGAKNYLLKPIDVQALQSAIESLVSLLKMESKQRLIEHLRNITSMQSAKGVYEEEVQHCFDRLQLKEYATVFISHRGFTHEEIESFFDLQKESLNRIAARDAKGIYVIEQIDSSRTLNHVIHFYRSKVNDVKENSPKKHIYLGICLADGNKKSVYQQMKNSETAALMGFYEPNQIHTFSQNMFSTTLNHSLLDQYQRDIIEKIEVTYSKEKLEEEINAYFTEFYKTCTHPVEVFQRCYNLLALIQKLVQNKKQINMQVSVFEEIQQHSFSQLKNYFIQFVSDALQHTETEMHSIEAVVENIKKYIESHYDEDVSLQAISEKFFIDKYQLSRKFKKQFGINYWPYVTKLRMEKAAELLGKTDLKITKIIEKIGFYDESHFSSAFKKYHGVSPKEYKMKVLIQEKNE